MNTDNKKSMNNDFNLLKLIIIIVATLLVSAIVIVVSFGICLCISVSVNPAIVRAVKNGDFERVKNPVNSRCNINESLHNGQSALMAAVDSGRIDIAEYLIEHGADANAENYQHGPALLIATEKGEKKLIKLLLKSGANCSGVFYHYVRNYDFNKIKLLVESGANLSDRSPWGSNNSPLLWAIDYRRYKAIKYLIDNGADVNEKTEFGYSPLFQAILTVDPPIVKLLLDSKAAVNTLDHKGRSPLDYALEYEDEDKMDRVIALLKKYGAKTGAKLNEEKEKTKEINFRAAVVSIDSLTKYQGKAYLTHCDPRFVLILDIQSITPEDCVIGTGKRAFAIHSPTQVFALCNIPERKSVLRPELNGRIFEFKTRRNYPRWFPLEASDLKEPSSKVIEKQK